MLRRCAPLGVQICTLAEDLSDNYSSQLYSIYRPPTFDYMWMSGISASPNHGVGIGIRRKSSQIIYSINPTSFQYPTSESIAFAERGLLAL